MEKMTRSSHGKHQLWVGTQFIHQRGCAGLTGSLLLGACHSLEPLHELLVILQRGLQEGHPAGDLSQKHSQQECRSAKTIPGGMQAAHRTAVNWAYEQQCAIKPAAATPVKRQDEAALGILLGGCAVAAVAARLQVAARKGSAAGKGRQDAESRVGRQQGRHTCAGCSRCLAWAHRSASEVPHKLRLART